MLRTREQRTRRGFALLAALALVAVAFVAAIASVAAEGALADRERIDLASKLLMELTDSTTLGTSRFLKDVGVYPGRVSHLSTAITTSQSSLCASLYKNVQVTGWTQPHYARELPTGGLWIGIGWVRDSIARNPTSGTPTSLIILIDSVDTHDARLLNYRFDPDSETTPQSEGRVQWGATDASGRVTVQWWKTVTSC